MPSTFTNNAGIELPADGEKDGVWGDVVNLNMQIVDRLTNGVGAVSLTGASSTLVTSDGTLNDGQYKVIVFGGSPSGTHTVTIQPDDAQKVYFVKNETAEDVVMTQGSGGNATVAAGSGAIVYANGVGTGSAVVDLTGNIDGRDISVDGAKLDTIEPNADVTDTANVNAAGALMDSQVDADIKTLTLPASTTISTYGATLVDDISASAARATLGAQAYAAGLTSIGLLAPAANRMLYTVGTNVYSSTSITAVARTFLSLNTNDSMRNTLQIQGLRGNGAGIEIGSDASGNRNCFLDLHASDGVDFSARIIRDAGPNGEMDITQNGSGALNLQTGGGAVRTNQIPDAADSSTSIATTSFVHSAIALTVRAWVNFSGSGTVTIRASRNVSSITDNGTGDYTVNFATNMPDRAYAVITTGSNDAGDTTYRNTTNQNHSTVSTSSCRIYSQAVNSENEVRENSGNINVVVFR